MADIWITSDLHFGHTNILKFCPKTRPWVSVEEMDEALLHAWNSTIKEKDEVYFLGDLSFLKFDNTQKLLRKLNGRITFVFGNHDTTLRGAIANTYFSFSSDLIDKKISGVNIVMCHYPLARWNKCHYGSLHLHGHCHGDYKNGGKSLDVGWDAHGKILHIEEAITLADKGSAENHHVERS